MISTLKFMTKQLIEEFHFFASVTKDLIDQEEKTMNEKLTLNHTDSVAIQLKKQEGQYDRLFETYKAIDVARKQSKKVRKCAKRIYETITQYQKEYETKKENLGNRLNKMFDDMKEKEKIVKGVVYDFLFEEEQYTNYIIQTEFEKAKEKAEKERLEEKIRQEIKQEIEEETIYYTAVGLNHI